MKRILATLIGAVLAIVAVSAQDLAQATELYNNGAAALSTGDKNSALEYFQQALSMANTVEVQGDAVDTRDELVANCKNIIPNIHLSIATDLFEAADYDGAVKKLVETAAIAKEFGDEETAAKAGSRIGQFRMQQGNSLIQAKDFAAAAEAYKSALEVNPTNGQAALRLGQALAGAGQVDEAIEAFKTAAENGQEKTANKQISNINLKKAAAALKAKKYEEAVAAANEANSYVESAQAYQVAGQASQVMGKEVEAIAYFEKYLTLSPNAKNAGQIAFTVGALYQKTGNKAKAVEFYQKAVTDPTYGAEAARLAASLK